MGIFFFSVYVSGHFECCKLITHEKGSLRYCEVSVVSCHLSDDLSLPARRAIAKHINDNYEELELELGFWAFTGSGPKRQCASAEGSCEVRRDSIISYLQAPPLPLRQRLTEALALKDRQQQVKELTEISIQAKALPCSGSGDKSNDEEEGNHSAEDSADGDDDDNGDNNRKLRRNALFALHGTKFEHDIRKGIADLEKTAVKQQVPMISRLIEYRAKEDQDLGQVFHDSDATTTDSKQARWESRIGNATAITVAEETGARCSVTTHLKNRDEVRRYRKLPYIILHIINAWIPVVGVDAVIIFSALQRRHTDYKIAMRDIAKRDCREFARFVAKRLGPIVLSKIPPIVPVVFPLLELAWAVRKEFSFLCKRLKLENIGKLHTQALLIKFDGIEAMWLVFSRSCEGKDETQKAVAVARIEQASRMSLKDWRESASAICEPEGSTVEPTNDDINNSTRRADPATDAGAYPRSSDDAGAGLGHANGIQIAECIRETDAVVPGSLFLPSQQSTDSGYASNVGSQQVSGTTSVASSSDPFLFEAEGGGERVRASAGQKRPQVGDNATTKRHRPSAAEIMEITENSEAGIEPSNADPAARSLRSTDGTPPTDVSTAPSQDGPLQGRHEVEHAPDFSVGSGMDFMDFWVGTGMDLQNVNLATPTGFPDF